MDVLNVMAPLNIVILLVGDVSLKVPLMSVRKLFERTPKTLELISKILELLVPISIVKRLKKVVAPVPEIL